MTPMTMTKSSTATAVIVIAVFAIAWWVSGQIVSYHPLQDSMAGAALFLLGLTHRELEA